MAVKIDTTGAKADLAKSGGRRSGGHEARRSKLLRPWNSMLRTTCVATLLEGGHASNALPQLAAANINCRVNRPTRLIT